MLPFPRNVRATKDDGEIGPSGILAQLLSYEVLQVSRAPVKERSARGDRIGVEPCPLHGFANFSPVATALLRRGVIDPEMFLLRLECTCEPPRTDLADSGRFR